MMCQHVLSPHEISQYPRNVVTFQSASRGSKNPCPLRKFAVRMRFDLSCDLSPDGT